MDNGVNDVGTNKAKEVSTIKLSVKTAVCKAVAKLGLGMAKNAAGAASWWDTYQPKEPAKLKSMCKKEPKR